MGLRALFRSPPGCGQATSGPPAFLAPALRLSSSWPRFQQRPRLRLCRSFGARLSWPRSRVWRRPPWAPVSSLSVSSPLFASPLVVSALVSSPLVSSPLVSAATVSAATALPRPSWRPVSFSVSPPWRPSAFFFDGAFAISLLRPVADRWLSTRPRLRSSRDGCRYDAAYQLSRALTPSGRLGYSDLTPENDNRRSPSRTGCKRWVFSLPMKVMMPKRWSTVSVVWPCNGQINRSNTK